MKVSPHFVPRIAPTAVGLVALVTALMPWWRNRGFLRDFLDYGLVMSSNGRIQAGESPYVDFLTPIQAGFLYLSLAFEKLLGGNYLGLTNGNFLLIVGSGLVLWFLLRTRLQDAVAIPLCWGIVVLTASQHTIFWYNAAGALYLTVATWSVAIAPVWRRTSWPWLTILAASLWLSGLNKISFHLVTLCGCLGLLIRFAILRKVTFKQLATNCVALGLFGILLPLATELLLTGASWTQWRFNILELATGGRLDFLAEFLSVSAYFSPIHNHYGDLAVPQIGAIIVLISVGIIVWGWRDRCALDRGLLIAASCGCAAASLALLGTNHEIAYLSLGAGLGLFASLTIAFDFRYRLFQVGPVLLLPALLVGLAAWQSAWQGDRSLFGHSSANRSEFVPLADQAPVYRYLAGVKIPPEMALSYRGLERSIPAPDAEGLHPIFYSKGVEWLERIWPAVKVPGQPLWMHQGTTYHTEQNERLNRALFPPARYTAMLEAVGWEERSIGTTHHLDVFAKTTMVGPLLRHHRLPASFEQDIDTLTLVDKLGTNFDPKLWVPEAEYFLYQDLRQRRFFGTTGLPLSFRFTGKMDQGRGEAILQRIESEGRAPLSATFRIDRMSDSAWETIWEQQLTLAPGDFEKTMPVAIEARQRELRFSATLAPDSIKAAKSGWLPPLMLGGPGSAEEPPPLVLSPPAVMRDLPDVLPALVHTDWKPDQVLIRDGRLIDDEFFLAARGEVWLRADRGLDALEGVATLATPSPTTSIKIVVLWFKAGRIQITDQFTLNSEQPTRQFRSWSSAHDGWFAVILHTTSDSSRVKIRIDKTQVSP